MNSSIVFIDPGVSDYQSLVGGVIPGTDVVVLEADRDGVQQITEVLLQHGLDSPASDQSTCTVHLVSHGAPGCLSLGKTHLSLDTLEQYGGLLTRWRGIASELSLLVYGCNVVAGDAGAEWLQRLHQLTGANIAASANLTGSEALGGDWTLETRLGEVTDPLAFTHATTSTYAFTLALSESDLVVVGYSVDAPNSFALLALADIPGGETVFITDRGWRSDNSFVSSGGDSTITWTTPAGGITAGTIIDSSEFPSSLVLSTLGDQILIYQETPATTFISAFSNDNSGPNTHNWLDSLTSDSSLQSALPAGTTAVSTNGGPGNAFGLRAEVQNAYYSGPTGTADKDTWISRINTVANWTTSNSAPYDFRPGSGFLPATFPVTLPDAIAPTLSSVVRQTPGTSPTNENTLIFRVTFSEDVQNVDGGDFTATGASGVTINASPVGSSATMYDVTVSGGTLAAFNGTVGLGLGGSQNIQDLAGNPLTDTTVTGTNDSYTLDNTGPTVTINQSGAQSDPATISPITFDVIFNESVSGFETGDISFGGTAPGSLVGTVSGSGTTYSVAVSGMTGPGTVIASINAGVAIDAVGNGNAASTSTDATITYSPDAIAPTLSSVVRQTPGTSPTNENTLIFRVTFSEDVQNVGGGDFTATGASGVTLNASPVGSSAREYDVTVSGGTLAAFNGTVGLGLGGSQNIQDLAGNPLTDTTITGTNDSYTLDNTAPTFSSVVRQNPSAESTNANLLTFRATFSEGVQNVDGADFSVSGVSGVTINASPMGSSTTEYDVTVSGGNLATFTGTVGLSLGGSQNIQDLVGNALTATTITGTNETYTLDNTAPTFSSVVRQNPPAESTNADTLTFRATFSEGVQNVNGADFSVSGVSGVTINASAVGASTTEYDVTVSGGNLATFTGTVGLSLGGSQNIQDLLGNALTATTVTGTNESYALDNTAPTFSSVVRQKSVC